MANITITAGLQFYYQHSSSLVTVSKIDGDVVDVMISPSDGHSFMQKGWSLKDMQSKFKSGYFAYHEKKNEVTVW